MGEIFACCDRVTVLRDGRFVGTSPIGEVDEATLVEQMIGRSVETGGEVAALRTLSQTPGTRADRGAQHKRAGDRVVLEVRALSSPGKLCDVRLTLHAGEVLGVGGLVGSGRSELLDAIFGLDPRAAGDVRIMGETMRTHTPRERIAAGVGYVPEDRKLQGLFFNLGIGENVVVPRMAALARAMGVRDGSAERAMFARGRDALRIKAASPSALRDALSGGNQQKLLLARWMGEHSRVLLLDEPTRVIDVGTKMEIARVIRSAAAGGVGVLLVSSEMPELLALSDRVIVLCDGRCTGELAGEQMTQKNVLTLATREDGT